MPGQFDKETSIKNFEWHRERVLREKRSPNIYTSNRVNYNLKAIEKSHGSKAVNEMAKEFNSREKNKKRQYFT